MEKHNKRNDKGISYSSHADFGKAHDIEKKQKPQNRVQKGKNNYSDRKYSRKENKIIVNAYNFVSLGDPKKIDIDRGKCKTGNLSGKLICTLENLTPLFTGGQKLTTTGQDTGHTKILFLCDSQNYIISASTLKGTIRNIIEVITTSCIRNVKENGVPEEFKPCTIQDKLCFACRLFGTIGNNEQQDINEKNLENKDTKTKEETTKDAVLGGRVFFTDAILKKSKAQIIDSPETISCLSGPKSEKKKYYYQPNSNFIRGRKFYWHHEDKIKLGKKIKFKNVKATKINSSVQYLKSDNIFTFEIGFKNLTDIELGVLIYSLQLEEGLAHKVGMGKPLGLGTCEISIEKLLFESKDKYRSFKNPYKNGDISFYKDICVKTYMDDKRKEIKELKMILSKENTIDFSERSYPQNGDLKKKILPSILDYAK